MMLDLIKETLQVEEVDSIDGVYRLHNSELYIQFIEPHKGTGWKYCLRADFPETFDRWSNCLYEEDFIAKDFEKVLSQLKEFVSDKENIVKEELGIN